MILKSIIVISIYVFVISLLAFRNKKWQGIGNRFVKNYKVVVPTIVFLLPLSFHIYNGTDLSLAEFLPLFLGFTLWSLIPYLLLVYLAGSRLNNIDLIFITVVMISIEVVANLKVHVFPGSSTDGLIFIFLPVYQLFIVLPVGLLICYIFRRLHLLSKRIGRA